jgi:hypothetical protein
VANDDTDLDLQPDPIDALTGTQIRHWASQWADGGLWDDILRLSGLFWEARSDPDRRIAWHHLVLAVGNFKREPGAALASRADRVYRQDER